MPVGNPDEGQASGDAEYWDRHRRWNEDFPMEPPFPGMKVSLNAFGEAVWSGPVIQITGTQKALEELIPPTPEFRKERISERLAGVLSRLKAR
jgi:hypothetical protein